MQVHALLLLQKIQISVCRSVIKKVSSRTSDRCHWCGDPLQICGVLPKLDGDCHVALRAPRNDMIFFTTFNSAINFNLNL